MVHDMKRKKAKKSKNPEFEDKSRDYIDGFELAEEYFEHIYKGGEKQGGAPYRVFVEAVALSMRKGENIGQGRMDAMENILKWGESEFNRGVYDMLIKRIKEYNTNKIIDQVIGGIAG